MAKDIPQIKVKVDSLEFGQETSADEVEGQFLDLCLPQPDSLMAWTEYPVVEQPPVGFKAISQSTAPDGLVHFKLSVNVFNPVHHQFLFKLKNFTPHYVICGLLEEKTLMFLTRKEVTYIKTGAPEYSFRWTLSFTEAYAGPA
jgi:hypothetical protein